MARLTRDTRRNPDSAAGTRRTWWLMAALVAAHLVAAGAQAPRDAGQVPAGETVEALRAASTAALATHEGEGRSKGSRSRSRWSATDGGCHTSTRRRSRTCSWRRASWPRRIACWQLDLWRRVAMGELSEVFGPRFVERDTFARLLRYRGDIEKEWQAYSPDTRSDRRRVRSRDQRTRRRSAGRAQPVARRVPAHRQRARAVDARRRHQSHGRLHHDQRRARRGAAGAARGACRRLPGRRVPAAGPARRDQRPPRSRPCRHHRRGAPRHAGHR